MESCEIDASNISVLGGDGTSNNTGWKEGSMTHLENILGKNCQRAVCLLHHYELPLRALFTHLDGTTAGPNCFSGPLGKMIATDVWKLPYNKNFKRLNLLDFPDVPEEVVQSLSTDAKLLHNMCQLANTGNSSIDCESLTKATIGKLFLSRWLTMATRVVRVYIAISEESELYFKVFTLVKYIVGVYWKMHIATKYKSSIIDGPQHIFDEISSIRKLEFDKHTDGSVDVLHKSIQTNCYFVHPENILLAMLGDKKKTVRAEAVRMITKVRRLGRPTNDIREFHLPELNFSAKNYYELVNFYGKRGSILMYKSKSRGTLAVTEPPLLMKCRDLKQFISKPLSLHYPCHTQSVERAVKLTTETTKRVSGQKRQIGEALNTIAARKKPWLAEGKKNIYVSRKVSLKNASGST